MVICLERGADLHMAQLMPLPLTVSCFSKIQIRNSCNKYTWWILKAFISLTELTSLQEHSALNSLLVDRKDENKCVLWCIEFSLVLRHCQ